MKKTLIALLLFVFVLHGCSAATPTTTADATTVAPTKESTTTLPQTDETTTPTTQTTVTPTYPTELIDKEFFTMEDFSAVVLNQTTYAEFCKLLPLAQQPEMTMFPVGCWCDYPTKDGSFIRVAFKGEDLTVVAILWYLGENSEHYPVKDIEAFSFVIPGETTIHDVNRAVPHPDYDYYPGWEMGTRLSRMDYALADGREVCIHFDIQTGIIEFIYILEDGHMKFYKAMDDYTPS